MKTVLVVAAEKFELSEIQRRCSQSGELNGMQMIFAANGPGAGLVNLAMNAVERPDAIVSTGLCGALDGTLAVGEVFVATRVNEFQALLPVTSHVYRSGELVSQDRVVVTAEEKSRLRATGASAVDMEAAAVAKQAQAWNCPFYCVRAVSDTAEETFALDLNSVRDAEGRFSVPRILGSALRRPVTVFPELLRMRRNAKRAAKALGEFFGHCRF